MATLLGFIERLESNINALQKEVLDSVSVVTSEGDFFAIVRRAGMLEGLVRTKMGLERLLKGEYEEDED